MSGIYIHGMEMPKDKAIAVVIHSDGTAYSAEMFAGVCTQYLKDCSAITVPDHGRLGDLDALKKKCEWANLDDDTDVRVVRLDCIDRAPTIIPADHADKEGE